MRIMAQKTYNSGVTFTLYRAMRLTLPTSVYDRVSIGQEGRHRPDGCATGRETRRSPTVAPGVGSAYVGGTHLPLRLGNRCRA